jgi:hypothetical protein
MGKYQDQMPVITLLRQVRELKSIADQGSGETKKFRASILSTFSPLLKLSGDGLNVLLSMSAESIDDQIAALEGVSDALNRTVQDALDKNTKGKISKGDVVRSVRKTMEPEIKALKISPVVAGFIDGSIGEVVEAAIAKKMMLEIYTYSDLVAKREKAAQLTVGQNAGAGFYTDTANEGSAHVAEMTRTDRALAKLAPAPITSAVSEADAKTDADTAAASDKPADIEKTAAGLEARYGGMFTVKQIEEALRNAVEAQKTEIGDQNYRSRFVMVRGQEALIRNISMTRSDGSVRKGDGIELNGAKYFVETDADGKNARIVINGIAFNVEERVVITSAGFGESNLTSPFGQMQVMEIKVAMQALGMQDTDIGN